MFITFEGIEGSGKSTLLELVGNELRERGVDHLQTREPGGTSLGDAVRTLFLDPDRKIEPMAEVMLLCASRAQLCTDVIRPALRAGKTVLCDRFYDATIAYQGYGRGLDIEELLGICLAATSGLTPDLTFVLDLAPDVSQQRVLGRSQNRGSAVDRIERESLNFHRSVRDGYLDMARRWSTRFVVLDALASPQALLERAMAAIERSGSTLRSKAQ